MALKRNKIYYVKWIARHYGKHWRFVLLLVLLTIVITVLTVVFPILLKYIVDAVVNNLQGFETGAVTRAEAEAETKSYIYLLLAMSFAPILNGIYPWLRHRGNVMFEILFRDHYFSAILKKEHSFFSKFRTGDLATRLTHDLKLHPGGLPWLCCSGIFRAFNSISIVVFCLIAMLLLNYKLCLAVCIPLPFAFFLFMKLDSRVSDAFKRVQDGVSEGNDFLEAAYSGIKIILSFNSQRAQQEEYAAILERRVGYEASADRIFGMFMILFEFLNYAGELFVLLFGGIMVIRGELTIGTYYAFFSYLGMIIFPLMDIPAMLMSLAQSSVSIDRLEEIEEYAAEKPTGGSDAMGAFEELELRNLSFTYPEVHSSNSSEAARAAGGGDEAESMQPLFSLKNVNLKIRRGERVAIVGQIGSGKSTLLALIAQILSPNGGEVLVNGRRLQELDLDGVRGRIGYIQQESLIFSETVRGNIDFWRGLEEEQLMRSAQLAQVDGEILGFSEGLDEELGQRGVNLSGGQRQRLCIARALAGRPELLLMDDITASLDAENEGRLWQELLEEFEGLSCLIVTHRAATAMMADRILVLRGGEVVGEGVHADLLRDCAEYAALFG
jgi:ATP-binding cassette subfamily B multidrug efflux pump